MEEQQKVLEEVLHSLEDESSSAESIQDNKLMFALEDSDELYRVRMPSQKERSIAIKMKNKEYWILVKEGQTPFEKDLIKMLKEKQGVDIEAMQKKLDDLGNELIQTSLSLAQKKDTEEKAIKLLTDKILKLKYERKIIVLEKSEYLAPCIDIQVEDLFYKVLTSFCTEKLIKDKEEKWEKVWNSYTDFEKDETILPLLAVGKFTDLFFH